MSVDFEDVASALETAILENASEWLAGNISLADIISDVLKADLYEVTDSLADNLDDADAHPDEMAEYVDETEGDLVEAWKAGWDRCVTALRGLIGDAENV